MSTSDPTGSSHDWSPPTGDHPTLGRMDRIACGPADPHGTRLNSTWRPWQPGTRHPAPEWPEATLNGDNGQPEPAPDPELEPDPYRVRPPRPSATELTAVETTPVQRVLFAPDGRAVMVLERAYAGLFGLPCGRRIAESSSATEFGFTGITVGRPIYDAAFVDDRVLLASTTDTDDGLPAVFRRARATAVVAGPFGLVLAQGNRLRRLDPLTLEPLQSISYGGVGIISRLIATGDGRTLIGVNRARLALIDGRLLVLRHVQLRTAPESACDAGAFLLPDGRHFVCPDPPARVIDSTTGDEVARMPYAIVAGSLDGRFAVGWADGRLHLLETGRASAGHVASRWSIPLPALPGHGLSAAFSGDARMVALLSASRAGIQVRRVADGHCLTPDPRA